MNLSLGLAVPLLAALSLPGCVRRTISITSNPDGALVWLNDREVGRTPLEVDFVYYGTYDVRVVLEGWEPLSTAATASPPAWDSVPVDIVSELIPADLESRVEWHFELEPIEDDPEGLRERARTAREGLEQAERAEAEPEPAAAGDDGP